MADRIAVLPTTYLTLKAEKVLERSRVPFRTVLKPRRVSSDCGLCIQLGEGDLPRAREALTASSLPARYYRREGERWVEDHEGL